MYGKGNFKKCLDFIKDLTRAFVVSKQGTHVGAIVFSADSQLQFDFNKYFTQAEVESAIDSITYPGATTFTGKGLKLAKEKLFAEARDGVPRILVVLTDGRSHDDVVKPADDLKVSGVTIFSVGLGTNYDKNQLNAIASEPSDDHVITANFAQMANFIGTLQGELCQGK